MKRILIGGAVFLVLAGIAYLSTLGCCQLLARAKRATPLSDQLGLTSAERQTLASLEKDFLAKKQATCQLLCQKRAQLIQLLKEPQPDQPALESLVEEIGEIQTRLERQTLGHLLAVRQALGSSKQAKLSDLISKELRTACLGTACGVTPGCALKEESR